MNTGTITATPVVSIPSEWVELLRKAMHSTREYYGDCILQLASPDAHGEDFDAETYGRWIWQMRWLDLVLPNAKYENRSTALSSAEKDGYEGVAAYAIREAAEGAGRHNADEYAWAVGAEHSGRDEAANTFQERRQALQNATVGLELWELVDGVTRDLDGDDLVRIEVGE